MDFFKKYIAIAVLSLNLGCSPSSLQDFRCEGEQRCRALLEELQKIHDRDQLVRSAPVLKKHFEDLVTSMIHARQYQEEHPEEDSPRYDSENAISASLQEELKRIYAMEGGREVVERAQQEALVRLDAFERACAKKKQALR